MKPEKILQSDVLDIIFEHRNKEYGAYAIRKQYDRTLLKAMGSTCLLVVLFVVLQSMQSEPTPAQRILEGATLTTVELLPPEEKKPKEEKQQPVESKKVKTITDFIPKISKTAPETTVNTQTDLSNTNVGNRPSDGDSVVFTKSVDPGPGDGPDVPKGDPVVTGPGEDGPLDRADVMPSFNGDLMKFMLRHLRQPDDLEAGERVMVKVRFVVTAAGEINDIHIVQSGRDDLDREVLRVMSRMPRWNPGVQGGRPVPVYFHLPVIFVSNAE